MKITIIFENKGKEKLKCGWGFSALLETGNDMFLFDTGNCGSDTISNLNASGFAVESLSKVVISHFHWDHTGGIFDLLNINPGITFYTGEDFGEVFAEEIERRGGKVAKGKDWRQLAENIYITPELKGDMAEQALVIDGVDSTFLLLGCSHPGVENFIKITYRRFKKPICFAGGFHYFPLTERQIARRIRKIKKFPILRVYPMHCTGELGVRLWKEAFPVTELTTGDTIHL